MYKVLVKQILHSDCNFWQYWWTKVRAPLKLGGVVIGRVSDITLDEKSYLPKVSIAINEEYKEIPENSSLSIKTSGLLGEQYIALTMGFDDGETAMLKKR